MTPQIKHSINSSGWEATDFPSLCTHCLPDTVLMTMQKEDFGAECKLCTRPFTVFSWCTDRAHGCKKRTKICLACARLQNCCQFCMDDLLFGLPIVVRDAALKMAASGPSSSINREYSAQNKEQGNKHLTEGFESQNVDDKARELLRRLATSKPYFRKGRPVEHQSSLPAKAISGTSESSGFGPIRTHSSKAKVGVAGPRKGLTANLGTISPEDWLPPANKNIASLFVTGIEDDLPEYKIREHFQVHGKIKSLVCSHMSHCAFVNFELRDSAEKAAAAFQGRTIIAGCPLRIRWAHPQAVGTMNKEERVQMIRDGRSAFKGSSTATRNVTRRDGVDDGAGHGHGADAPLVIAPPGKDLPKYASMGSE